MSVTAAVNYSVIEIKGNIGQAKVRRYWPGKAPELADDHEDNNDIQMSGSVVLEKGYDRRLSRLAKNRLDDKEEIRANHRRIRQEEIVLNDEEESLQVEEDDEDAVYEHRRMLKEKLLRREQQEKNAMIIEEEEEDEESEYEMDSENEQGCMAMMKPVFVKKSERDTIAEREKIEAEERAVEELMKMRVEERKVETKQIVVEEIRKDIEIQKNKETDDEIADVDTDEENIVELYLAWMPREIARIKRDREIRDAMVQEKDEIERVRNMTEEERKEWEKKNAKPDCALKQKWKYMQRYYHKGAFFQDEPDDSAGTAGADGILQRDAPTGEDKMDRTWLPKVMQVKHFGRSGRTKWTHLVNEDTTDWNNLHALYPIC